MFLVNACRIGAVALLAAGLLLAASGGLHPPEPHQDDLWRRTADGWQRTSTWPRHEALPPPVVSAPLWAAAQLVCCLAALTLGARR